MRFEDKIDTCVATLAIAESIYLAAAAYKAGIPFLPAFFGFLMCCGAVVCFLAAITREGLSNR